MIAGSHAVVELHVHPDPLKLTAQFYCVFIIPLKRGHGWTIRAQEKEGALLARFGVVVRYRVFVHRVMPEVVPLCPVLCNATDPVDKFVKVSVRICGGQFLAHAVYLRLGVQNSASIDS